MFNSTFKKFTTAAGAAILATGIGISAASAQECFIGEVRMFAGNFAPRNWAFTDGQLLAISQNTALFSILGTTYGGDGRTTFALPDLRGRTAIHVGRGPGLSDRRLGEKLGTETNTLTANELPAHSHPLQATTAAGDSNVPTGRLLADDGSDRIYASGPANTGMAADSVGSNPTSNQPVNNMQPSLGINHIICLFGIFPSRS